MSRVSDLVEDDPAKPYKAVIGVAFLVATCIVMAGDFLPDWLVGVAGAIVTGITIYMTPNPKRSKTHRNRA